MAKPLKYSLIVIGVVAVAIVLFALVFDWNMLRGTIERKVTEKTGREFSIGGDIDVRWLSGNGDREWAWPVPYIHFEQVRFGNAAWGSKPIMVEAAVAEFSIKLPDLMRGNVVLPQVVLIKPIVLLEKNREGVRNWQLDPDRPEGPGPVIGELRVDHGTLNYRDPNIGTDLEIDVAVANQTPADGPYGIRFAASGNYKNRATSATGRGGSALKLTDQNTPFPIDGKLTIGQTSAVLQGTITNLLKLTALDLQLDLRGADMAELYPILKLNLPKSPPYRVAGRLWREGGKWRFSDFSGTVGDSDLAGDIVAIDTSVAERISVRADLTSQVLDFNDLAGFVGAEPATGPGQTASKQQKKAAEKAAGEKRALPDEGFPSERLRSMDADVKYKAKQIRSRKALPLDSLVAHLKIEDGKLTVQPLNFGFAGGNIVSSVALDARKEPVTSEATVQFKKLRLKKLMPTVEMADNSSGEIGGSAEFKSTGNSASKILAGLDGRLGLAMDGGEISNLLLEFVGLDGGEIIKFLLAGDQRVAVRCAVGQFAINDGLMKTEVFVIDTRDTIIRGDGTINLGKEELDLTLNPLPKDISIFSGRSPLHVTGSFKDPNFAPDKSALAKRGGAAILLGLINPLAALIPLIETGPGKDSNCAKLMADAKSQNSGAGKKKK
ncbi:MAG: AsmA family protein [Burkholderiales bacterium]|nr:AsmA family protein [Burkholderiales bacterium]